MATLTRIKRIAPLQLGKMFAVIYGLLSLIMVSPFYLLFIAIMIFSSPAQKGGWYICALLSPDLDY